MPLYKRQEDKLFYANIAIKLPIQIADSYFDKAFEIMENIDQKYNSYSPNSLLSAINNNAGNWTKVDETMFSILERGYGICQLFGGQYDISIFPLLELWGFYKKEAKVLPNAIDIQLALKKVDYRQIQFNENAIKIGINQRLTTGSFLKAYAVDEVINFLKKENISAALINAGGSTIYGLADEHQPYWIANIIAEKQQKPNSLFKIKLKNKCLSTSIQYQKPLILEGQEIGHILNAKTGFPTKNRQVGIISENAMLGDMLSTAFMTCSASSFKEKMSEIQSIWSDIEGFLIDESGEIYTSAHFSAYLL